MVYERNPMFEETLYPQSLRLLCDHGMRERLESVALTEKPEPFPWNDKMHGPFARNE